MKLKNYLILTSIGKNTAYFSKLNNLYLYEIESKNIEKIYAFKSDFFTHLSKSSKLFRRLFRKDIRYSIPLDKNNLLLVKDKKIYRFNLLSKQIESEIDIPKGSRPLNMTSVNSLKEFNNGIYFGEYFNNPTKESVKIYLYSNDKLIEMYKFKKGLINHIHNLIVDNFRNCLWILTGDFEIGAAIYQATNNFKSVKCIVSGDQKYRSCVAFPTKEGLIYATDTQFEQNSIRLLNKQNFSWQTKKLCDINGPSIYGTQIKDKYFFSTSVEAINSGSLIHKYIRNSRGPGIIKNQSEIVMGNIQKGFRVVYSNKKDILPFMLFQFGNILFPTGNNNLSKLIFTNVALKKDDLTTNIVEL